MNDTSLSTDTARMEYTTDEMLAMGRAVVERSVAHNVHLAHPPARGDMYAVDVLGARAAGLQAVLFDPLGAWNGADCVVLRDLRELVKMLRNR